MSTYVGIIPAEAAVSAAPSLASSIQTINRRRAADDLQRKLRRRKSREELFSAGVLHANDSIVAPSLHAAQSQLRFLQCRAAVRERLGLGSNASPRGCDMDVDPSTHSVEENALDCEIPMPPFNSGFMTVPPPVAKTHRRAPSRTPAFLVELIKETEGY
jgi:hypothetical protein